MGHTTMECHVPPSTDDWTEPTTEPVAPGVHRIPLPLPSDALRAVNVYAVEDGEGLTLVDAGWGIAAARTALEDALARIGHELGDVRRFLVTHLHRDHYELSVLVRGLFGSRILLGSGERVAMDSLRTRQGPSPLLDRLRVAGAGDLLTTLLRVNPMDGEDIDWQPPDAWLDDHDLVDVGARQLEALATPGHTRGHVVFVDHAAGLLFAGDHVLPHITPSIGFEEVPLDSALVDYLASLARVRELPELQLLPAHGPVQATTHDRVDELLVHHDLRLDQTVAAVRAGAATAWEAADAIPWTRRQLPFQDLDPFNQMLAVNETLAHLDALVARGRATRDRDDDVRLYSALPSASD